MSWWVSGQRSIDSELIRLKKMNVKFFKEPKVEPFGKHTQLYKILMET